MLWLAAALLSPLAHAEDLTVVVDADVSHVTLVCDSDKFEADTASGSREADGRRAVTFPIRPGRQCNVTVTRQLGSLEQLGKWSCTNSGCTQLSGATERPQVAPGEVLILVKTGTGHNQLELTCPSGYRERTMVADFKGSFTGVPAGDECTLNFKGGSPMKFTGVGQGAWECHLVSNTPVCQKL